MPSAVLWGGCSFGRTPGRCGAQNLLWRPWFIVCITTKMRVICNHGKAVLSLKNNRLGAFGPQHGVLGVECSNHSVPTIFLKEPNL